MAVLLVQPRPARRLCTARSGCSASRLRGLHLLLDPPLGHGRLHSSAAALWLIGMRVESGVQRRRWCSRTRAPSSPAPSTPGWARKLALGISNVSMVVGSFFGLVLGGLLALGRGGGSSSSSHRSRSGSSRPSWSCRSLPREARRTADRDGSTGGATSRSRPASILLMVDITYRIQPYGARTWGGRRRSCSGGLLGGLALPRESSASSKCTPTSRCSTSTSSASGPSRPGTSPPCSRR